MKAPLSIARHAELRAGIAAAERNAAIALAATRNLTAAEVAEAAAKRALDALAAKRQPEAAARETAP